MKNAIRIILIALISTSTIIAQVPLNGPPANVTVRDVSVSGSTIYAADAFRLMKSTNSGSVWNPTVVVVEEPYVVTSNPTDANFVVVGKKDTVRYSSNGGDSWDLTTGIHPLRLKRSPDSIKYLYLGSKYSSGNSSLRSSRSNGASLTPDAYFRDVVATNVTDVAVRAGSSSQEIWVAGTDVGIATNNIPPRKKGVWATFNGGTTWDPIIHDIDATAIGVSGTDRLVGTKSGKLFMKRGIANSFEVNKIPSTKTSFINTIQRVGQWWFIGAKKGLFRMDNATLDTLERLKGRQVFSIQVVNSTTLYAASDRGIYRSTDSGVNWVLITQTTLRGAKVTGVAAVTSFKAPTRMRP